MKQQILESLKKQFGFSSFRPGQEEIIDAVLEKKDSFVLMPTGGGKSLCYQLPATVLPGITIVVSPLIALMKDQVEGLLENGIAANYLNSSLDDEESRDVIEAAKEGELKLLYVSPEKLLSVSFRQLLREMNVSLFAIDEAHCISSWGHDFRKEYTQLGFLKRDFPSIPIIALTATADKLTRRDILFQLGLDDPQVFISSFDRPNLKLTVLPAKKRLDHIIRYVANRKGESGIIYCLSRKQTEKVATALLQSGVKAGYYHAGMQSHERESVQEDFIYGRTPVIVATIAFGMGIDKSDVRYVIHHNMPKNIEGYYQEIGRAGRDGMPSDTVLFYTLADVILLKRFAEQSGQAKLQLAKLERMQQFADALICRRRMLLAYFGEQLPENCNNCDVCENPPALFDGTELVQKALSCILRAKQQVPAQLLIDILRGSSRQEVTYNGYHLLSTYGIGKDIPAADWQQYLLQMLSMGLIDVAYDQHHALKITAHGKEVLVKKLPVQLVSQTSIDERAARLKDVATKSLRKTAEEQLFDEMRELRRTLAKQKDIPPYQVFTDATLDEMARVMPLTKADMKQITGVGDKKLASYGDQFIQVIASFLKEQGSKGKKIQGSTQQITFSFYKDGAPVPQIARERDLKEQTIYSHLAELYEQGYDINIFDFMDKRDLKKLLASFEQKGIPKKLKPLFDRFKGAYSYHVLKFAIAHHRRESAERGVIRYE